MPAPTRPRVLILLFRRDLRLHDNPLFHNLTHPQGPAHTYLLPLYIFNPREIEVSGFLSDSSLRSPLPECRSSVGKFWRCGPHRAKWIAECVWDFRESLRKMGSELVMRVGRGEEVVGGVVKGLRRDGVDVAGVWMTGAAVSEEREEEERIRGALEKQEVPFEVLEDTGYLYTLKELPMEPKDLPDVFTEFRKKMEPLRSTIPDPTPAPSKLPPPPPTTPPQPAPFVIPATLPSLISALQSPLKDLGLPGPPLTFPPGAKSAHPFHGGETHAKSRLHHLLTSGALKTYKDTRSGLLGPDFSTKLSGYLAQGCISAQFINHTVKSFEDGDPSFSQALIPGSSSTGPGFGEGENTGTQWLRFELLWRDYFRLCALKYKENIFSLAGYRNNTSYPWQHPSTSRLAARNFPRFLRGSTGTTLIDASQRELYHTGYTSNRARQNVSSFLAKRLHIDWRLGAEWYMMLLADYDAASNWGNWMYNAGVGNDPRGAGRVFNQVKQMGDFDPKGEYVRCWMEEIRGVEGMVAELCVLRGEVRERVKGMGEDARLGVEESCVFIGVPEGGFKAHRGKKEGGGGGNNGGGRGGKKGEASKGDKNGS